MPAEFAEMPLQDVRGVCDVCGAKAYHPRAKKCNEHREDGKEFVEAKRSSDDDKDKNKRSPNANKWDGLTRKFLIILTSLLATAIIHNAEIIDPSNELEDRMTVTDSEAAALAKPLSRMIAGTNFSKKHGASLVENEDMVDAAIAAYDYTKRLLETQRMIKDVVNHREQATHNGPPMNTPTQVPPRQAPTQPMTEVNNDNGTDGQAQEARYEGPPRGVYAPAPPWAYGG